ncbi:MAG: DUF4178 domain-containing protein [Pyrinomonadaceae bacterium]
MSILRSNCPSCAAPIEFQGGSTVVVVCPYCRSAVARTDRGLEDLGKVAEVADSESPLRLGLKGVWNNVRFELTGRAQLRHSMGGVWDEWYATFSNGWVGWLAEAQGRFYLTFFQPLPQGTVLPTFDALQPGATLPQIPSPSPLMVQEKGTATYAAADGEIPYKLVPNEQVQFADLAGRDNAFATIDYSFDPPWVFSGKQVTLEEIGLGDARPVKREARSVSSAAMGCPNCGGPLELTAPDRTERVTCPNCDSLLDVNEGNLKFFKTLAPPAGQPVFVAPIGAEGTMIDGNRYKIIGAVVRSVTIDGEKYFWHEYLLYNPMIGFRWLVHSDNHWNFVEPINPAEVEVPDAFITGSMAKYDGRSFKIFQDANAVVEYVKGEFYWRVEQGETVRATDFVLPPQMLSREATGSEVNWSLGTYVSNEEIERAFGVTGLPRPWGVAPNQPFTGQFWYTWALLPLAALFVVAIFMLPLTGATAVVYDKTIVLQPMPNAQAAQISYSEPFDLKANRNIRITASAPVSNSWADLDVDLVNERSEAVESIDIPIEYYSGTEDGEAWSEGGPSQDASLSSLPAGRYTLTIEGTWQNWQQPMPVSVKVEQGYNRGVNFVAALVLLLIVPFLGLIRKWSFEHRRWKDSMFTTTTSGGDDSDE